jgi:hypothetical protein
VTAPQNDPWAAASGQPAQNAAPSETALATTNPAAAEGQGMLFGGGPSFPSLFNKTHFTGTRKRGRIKKVMDVQGRDFDTKKPAVWPDGSPKMEVHFTLETEYRISEQECYATDRDVSYVQEDDGTRVFVAGGYNLKTVQEAMKRDAPGLGVRSYADLEGKFIEVARVGQTQRSATGNKSWDLEVKFTAS